MINLLESNKTTYMQTCYFLLKFVTLNKKVSCKSCRFQAFFIKRQRGVLLPVDPFVQSASPVASLQYFDLVELRSAEI